MKWNTQTDKIWHNDVMTHPKGQEGPDLVWRWGCIMTSFANIVQFFFDNEMTPGMMNHLFIENNCYRYLDDPETPMNRASEIYWDNVKKLFYNELIIKNRVSRDVYSNKSGVEYIARVKHRTGGSHYVNVLSKTRKNFWCFDVEDGIVKPYKHKDVEYLHEIRRI